MAPRTITKLKDCEWLKWMKDNEYPAHSRHKLTSIFFQTSLLQLIPNALKHFIKCDRTIFFYFGLPDRTYLRKKIIWYLNSWLALVLWQWRSVIANVPGCCKDSWGSSGYWTIWTNIALLVLVRFGNCVFDWDCSSVTGWVGWSDTCTEVPQCRVFPRVI